MGSEESAGVGNRNAPESLITRLDIERGWMCFSLKRQRSTGKHEQQKELKEHISRREAVSSIVGCCDGSCRRISSPSYGPCGTTH